MSNQDTCANCDNRHSQHAASGHCEPGSNCKWFPRVLAEALNEPSRKLHKKQIAEPKEELTREVISALSREGLEEQFWIVYGAFLDFSRAYYGQKDLREAQMRERLELAQHWGIPDMGQ